jgi:NADH:ubiquinone oxidoreductase subunit 4 (subunit M)
MPLLSTILWLPIAAAIVLAFFPRTADTAIKGWGLFWSAATFIVSLGLLVAGIVLIVYGFSALESISSSFSRFFTGSPTDKTMWLLIGGVICACVGLTGIARGSKS